MYANTTGCTRCIVTNLSRLVIQLALRTRFTTRSTMAREGVRNNAFVDQSIGYFIPARVAAQP